MTERHDLGIEDGAGQVIPWLCMAAASATSALQQLLTASATLVPKAAAIPGLWNLWLWPVQVYKRLQTFLLQGNMLAELGIDKATKHTIWPFRLLKPALQACHDAFDAACVA